MILTKSQAIKECKLLWQEIAESGLSKYSFLRSANGNKWVVKGYRADCPLCDYVCDYARGKGIEALVSLSSCKQCPLVIKYGATCITLYYEANPKRFNEFVQGLEDK